MQTVKQVTEERKGETHLHSSSSPSHSPPDAGKAEPTRSHPTHTSPPHSSQRKRSTECRLWSASSPPSTADEQDKETHWLSPVTARPPGPARIAYQPSRGSQLGFSVVVRRERGGRDEEVEGKWNEQLATLRLRFLLLPSPLGLPDLLLVLMRLD
jgi:hypothetical protein